MNENPDALTLVSYLIAAAILIPVGWWLERNLPVDEWLRAFFY